MNQPRTLRHTPMKDPSELTKAKDTGMAFCLIAILIGLLGAFPWAFRLAAILLLLTMTIPVVFEIPSRFWFWFSDVLGNISSRILLSLIFFLVVVPMGIARSLLGKDAMRRKEWKSGQGSVFRESVGLMKPEHLNNPF